MKRRPSEFAEAMQIAAALPQIQAQELARLDPLLRRLTISDVSLLADAIEKHYRLSVSLRAAIMQAKGEKVRVAEWHVDADRRCQHKRYAVGNTGRAKHGEIGDETWLEAWIA
ncbi:MAG TPA: hypothetical protein VKT83_18005 [bacterium]|nr:hypothetical protein [bacterium]